MSVLRKFQLKLILGALIALLSLNFSAFSSPASAAAASTAVAGCSTSTAWTTVANHRADIPTHSTSVRAILQIQKNSSGIWCGTARAIGHVIKSFPPPYIETSHLVAYLQTSGGTELEAYACTTQSFAPTTCTPFSDHTGYSVTTNPGTSFCGQRLRARVKFHTLQMLTGLERDHETYTSVVEMCTDF